MVTSKQRKIHRGNAVGFTYGKMTLFSLFFQSNLATSHPIGMGYGYSRKGIKHYCLLTIFGFVCRRQSDEVRIQQQQQRRPAVRARAPVYS
jgi:hypothetical protein